MIDIGLIGSRGGAETASRIWLKGRPRHAGSKARTRPAGARLTPSLWLRLEQADPHPMETALGLPGLVLGEALLRELADAGVTSTVPTVGDV